jgi:transposase
MASPAVRAHARAGRRNTTSPRTSPPPPPPPAAPVRPLPQDAIDRGHRHTIIQRVQCLTLLAEGFSGRDIKKKTGVKPSAQSYIKKRAYDRGFRPEQDPRILDYYVQDGARSGRPKEITLTTEQRLLKSVKLDRSGREKSSEVLAYECGISRSSALRILHKYGLSNVKPTRKPGLNAV